MKLNLTPEGKDILLHCLEGGPSPVFNAIVLGNGANAGEDATSLSNQLVAIEITNLDREEGADFITLTGVLNNSAITDRFRATETGVTVVNPDNPNRSLLFAYGYAGEDEAAVIPAAADYTFETTEQCIIYVGQTQNITAILSESMQTATKAELQQHTGNNRNPHGVSAEQIGLGNVPNVATNDQTPTFEQHSTLAYLYSGETLSTLFGKLKTAVNSLISHIMSRSNPHNVTASQAGAAPSLHSHAASQITSGVLSVARGGTGVNNLSDLTTVLGSTFGAPEFGTYTGNGGTKRLISLPFTPKAVLLVDDTGMLGDDVKGTCGGLAIGSAGVVGYSMSNTYATTWHNDYTALMITTNGFYVNYTSGKVRTNTSGATYRYIAWR